MKLGLLGHGKMGKLIEQLTPQRGHSINPTPEVWIDFSHPDAVMKNVELVCNKGGNLVIGTTGWYHQLDSVKKMVEEAGIGMIYAPNFSIGVALYLQIIKQAAEKIQSTGLYDVAGIEWHHNEKVDAPSGTAKAIANQIEGEVPFASVRCGSIPGKHQVIFDSQIDTITLTHEARSREGFAHGAITAAEWIQNKKGIFTLEEMLNDTI